MRCIRCNKELDVGEDFFPSGNILENCDGDFTCGQECHEKHVRERDHFLEHILPDDRRFAQWLGVPEEWVSEKGV